MFCSECGAQFEGNFCPECGNPEGGTKMNSPAQPVVPSVDPHHQKRENNSYKQTIGDRKFARHRSEPFFNESEKRAFINSVIERARRRANEDLLYYIKGAYGKQLKVYPYKCVITTDFTFGSVLNNTFTDGEKTIYFKDCIGVQYKSKGATDYLGYLQFETSSSIMRKTKSNEFNENTFAFGGGEIPVMNEIYEFIIGVLDEIKSK